MLLLLDFWIGFLEKWIKLKHTQTTHTCGLTNTLDFLETPVPKRSQAIPSVRIETMGKNAFLKQSHPGFSWKKTEWLILPSDFKSLLKGWTWNRTWLAAAFDISLILHFIFHLHFYHRCSMLCCLFCAVMLPRAVPSRQDPLILLYFISMYNLPG